MQKHSTTKRTRSRPVTRAGFLTTTDFDKWLKARSKWDKSQLLVRSLIERILVDEDNDQARALIALVDLLTFERKELVDREALSGMAMNHAYTQTLMFGSASLSFRDEAMKLLGGK